MHADASRAVQDIGAHVAVVLDEALGMRELAARLDRAVEDYKKGVYDEHIKRAYCAARTHYNYRDIIDRYMEPVFRDADAHFHRT
jgi:hypothetical protein